MELKTYIVQITGFVAGKHRKKGDKIKRSPVAVKYDLLEGRVTKAGAPAPAEPQDSKPVKASSKSNDSQTKDPQVKGNKPSGASA